MLKNMKIGKKLIITFTTIAIIASLSGITSAFLIKSVDNVNNIALYTYAMPQGDIGKAMLALTQCQKAVCNIISFTDQEDIDAQKEDYQKNWKNYNEVYSQAVRDGLVTEEGKAIWTKIEAKENQWISIKDRAVKLGDTTDPVKTLAAQRILVDELVPAFQQFYNEYAELMNQKVDMGKITADQATKQANVAILINISVVIAALVIAVILGAVISKGISNPINKCVERLNKLAEGDLQSAVPVIANRDETGQLAESTKIIAATMSGIIEDVGMGLAGIADGNLSIESRAKELYMGDFSKLAVSLYQILNRLNETILQIYQSSEQVSSGSEQMSSAAQALSQGATEQASTVQELAATITEISEHVKDNATKADLANKKMGLASEEINESNQKMQMLINAMDEISCSSQEIGKVIKTIEDIAFQTNILALNAAVEAASAGEAGKGFAIIADEVRNLASKSAEAAKSTTALIKGAISSVQNGTQLADDTAKALSDVMDASSEVSQIVTLISKASEEQAISISQVTAGVDQISGVVQMNSATAEESAAASEELSGQAAMLKQLVGNFKLRNSSAGFSTARMPKAE